MIRTFALIGLLTLGACGGSQYANQNSVTSAARAPAVMFAQGPISRACLSAGQKQASPSRCGCVQAVANIKLSSADQRKGAAFFKDPQRAQDIRQSDNPSNEAFWARWRGYANEAARLCT